MNRGPERCPICHSPARFAESGTRIHGDHEILICQTCGGYSLWPEMHVAYDRSAWTAKRHDQWRRDEDVARTHAPRILDAYAAKTGRRPETVLEIGCGSGFMGRAFESAGCRYTGIDIDEDLIGFGREQGMNVHRVPAEELMESHLAGERFDLILSSNTFEHLRHPPSVFQAVSRLCLGLVAVVTPNAEGLTHRLKASRAVRDLYARARGKPARDTAYSIDGTWHNIAYTKGAFRLLCARHELTIDELRTIGINDPVWGFVQRNESRSYRLMSVLPALVGMQTQLLLVCRPTTGGRKARG